MKIYTIAELAQVHDGSLGTMYCYVDALADLGVSAVKFQIHIAEAESSSHEPFRIKFSNQDATRYDYWQRMEFTQKEWKELFEHTKSKGLDVVVSVFSVAAFELVKDLKVDVWKIASGEVSNLLLLDIVRQDSKPIILSSGLSDFDELERAYNRLSLSCKDISVLHCVSKYPTPLDETGVHLLDELKQRFPDAKIGLSDHSAKISTSLLAVSYGAQILEFHIVADRRMFGPDSIASLEFNEVGQLVEILNDWSVMEDASVKLKSDLVNTNIKQVFGKSLSVNRDMPKGALINIADLESKKPGGMGIPAGDYESIIGKKLKRDLSKWDFLNNTDLK